MTEVTTREFVIGDYDGAIALWNEVEGVEICEGDSRGEIAEYLKRNPGLSRVAGGWKNHRRRSLWPRRTARMDLSSRRRERLSSRENRPAIIGRLRARLARSRPE